MNNGFGTSLCKSRNGALFNDLIGFVHNADCDVGSAEIDANAVLHSYNSFLFAFYTKLLLFFGDFKKHL